MKEYTFFWNGPFSNWYPAESKLLKKLLENSNFVEASPYDKVWGVGLAEENPLILDEKNWRGENLLGKVLDKVKETLS